VWDSCRRRCHGQRTGEQKLATAAVSLSVASAVTDLLELEKSRSRGKKLGAGWYASRRWEALAAPSSCHSFQRTVELSSACQPDLLHLLRLVENYPSYLSGPC
jgi:hypothetical protein